MATGMKGLMIWCKNITKNYGQDVEIKNMASSWKDGMAFCAILHHYRPDLIDFQKLSKENVAENNELAFRIAEEELGIPALLDVEDMVAMRVPDRLSIMTYVSQYYNYFRDKIPGEIVTHRIPSKKRPNTETIEAVPAKVSGTPGRLTVRNGNQVAQSGVANACFTCRKTVYLMERLSVEGKLFHRICFKCCTCSTQLKTSTYEFDGNEQKFYCEKHFKDRGKLRDEPEGKEQTPEKPSLSNIQEDVAMTDPEPSTDIHSSPFIRNDQFFRKGIRPQSSPADLNWEKTKIIKSKEEEHKVPEKTKTKSPSKKLLSVLKKKTSNSSEKVDFANPAYQQHLELANFMDQLDSKDSETASDRIVIGSEANEATFKEKTSTLSGVEISDPQIKKFSGDVENQKDDSTNTSKGIHKKKLVLKVKKKKKKHQQEEEKNKDEAPNEVVPVKFNRTSSTSSNYENIENFTNVGEKNNKEIDVRYQDDAKIYDNNHLCTVLNDSEETAADEIHYAEPSLVDIPMKIDPSDDNIYHNISPSENNEKEENPILLAARNRLQSSGIRSEKNEQRRSSDYTADTQYLDIRSHLRKVKSTENISDVDSNTENTPKTDVVGQVFLNARAHLNKTSKSNEFINSEMNDTNQKLQNETSSPSVYPNEELHKSSNSTSSISNLNMEDTKVDNESGLKFSPFKVEKKNAVKLQKLSSPISKEKPEIFEQELDLSQNKGDIADNAPDHMDIDHEEEKTSSSDPVMKNNDQNDTSNNNPFLTPESSPSPIKKLDNTNPFLSSNEDLLFESGDDEFDDSNPFAEDARLERKDTLSKQASLKRGEDLRQSLTRKKDLQQIGIDESNPFADDLLEEMDDSESSHVNLKKQPSVHVPDVVSHMPTGGRRLVLKNKHGQKLHNRPVSAPVFLGAVLPVAVPRPKKRSAPKPPEHKVEPVDSPPTSGKGTLKKRAAPKRPSVLPEKENSPDGKTDEYKTNNTSVQNDDSINSENAVNKDVSLSEDGPLLESKSLHDSPSLDSDQSTPVSSPGLNRRVSEKRKAPARPPQPDEDTIMQSVALRDKQPKREVMEKELQFLETRQRELEMEGVVMEKKLRDCSDSEPEEAYLLTWFELVNQKNLLLRRENELIFLCQELDFLQNQRRAEFELRQLMNKPDHLKTFDDRIKEDALLADILNFVTKRSNIVDQMDEDRLREYEEDQEISHMMEAQGFSSPTHEKIVEKVPKEKVKKKKDKENKEKKHKEKVKKKKSNQ